MDYENKSTAVDRRISPKFRVINPLVAPKDGSKDGEDDLEYKGVETIDNLPLGKIELHIFQKTSYSFTYFSVVTMLYMYLESLSSHNF